MKKTSAERRKDGIAKQLAQTAQLNIEALAAAKYDNGTWTFSLHGQAPSWNKTAHRMIQSLAERESVTADSISARIMLPDYGRTFAKAPGSNTLISHG